MGNHAGNGHAGELRTVKYTPRVANRKPNANQPGPIDPASTEATIAAWALGEALMQQCVEQSQLLRQQVRLFLEQPSQESLEQSRQAWHRAHLKVSSFAVFFAIADSNPGLFRELSQHRDNLDTQPIQPGFIDYFDVYQHSGIVNDLAVNLSAESLRAQHGITDVSDVSIGFHAMEYLLWGENGQRPPSDFHSLNAVTPEQGEQGLRVVDLPNNRRRVYLQLLAEILVDDCQRSQQAWSDPSQQLYRNYHSLQTPSRLQLWQAAANQLLEEVAPATASPSAESDDAQTTDNPAHNLYAGANPGVLRAQLAGLAQLLFGNDGADDLDNPGIASWLNPELKTISQDLQQFITNLPTSESESLAAAIDPDNLQALLAQVRQALTNIPNPAAPAPEPIP